jgi:hypothetical protein
VVVASRKRAGPARRHGCRRKLRRSHSVRF